MLLLPRAEAFYDQHPLHAFSENPTFLSSALSELQIRALPLAASELARLHGAHSAQDKARRAAMSSSTPPPPDLLPSGRDWTKELRVGVHANPSMNHLHIHIVSADMHSECVRHRKHYQSFATEFLVRMGEFPLEEGEIRGRREGARECLNERGMRCWRCGREFGNKFKKLKEHLEEEFEAWRRE